MRISETRPGRAGSFRPATGLSSGGEYEPGIQLIGSSVEGDYRLSLPGMRGGFPPGSRGGDGPGTPNPASNDPGTSGGISRPRGDGAGPDRTGLPANGLLVLPPGRGPDSSGRPAARPAFHGAQGFRR